MYVVIPCKTPLLFYYSYIILEMTLTSIYSKILRYRYLHACMYADFGHWIVFVLNDYIAMQHLYTELTMLHIIVMFNLCTSVLCVPWWNMLVLFSVLTTTQNINSLESVQCKLSCALGIQQQMECYLIAWANYLMNVSRSYTGRPSNNPIIIILSVMYMIA